jgi:predicted NBD/HSP70 family sugar kinase
MSALQPASFNWADARWFEGFWSRHSVGSLREAVQQALGLPTSILNNPQSAAIAEALRAPVQARLVYIMLGLSLGAAFVNGRELNQDLWRYAGEIGYVIYRDAPLNRVLSVSGLRDFLGLPQPQGEYEPIVAATLAAEPERLAPWFEQAAERLRLIVNFLENTMRPDGVVIGGFVPNGYLEELVRRVAPLPSSVVLDEHDPTRIMPRFALARHSFESIPFGAAAMTLSSRANPRFPALIGARRSVDSAVGEVDATA